MIWGGRAKNKKRKSIWLPFAKRQMLIRQSVWRISPFVMEKGEELVCNSPTILIVRENFFKQPALTPGNGEK